MKHCFCSVNTVNKHSSPYALCNPNYFEDKLDIKDLLYVIFIP